MAKTYIVSPNFVTGPAALKLGDILVNPLGPEIEPLNRKCRLPIDPTDLKEVGIQHAFSATRGTLLSGRFGLWSTFLATLGIPIGADIGVFLERKSNDVIKAGELETHEFSATDKYVDDVLAKPDVKGYLEARKYSVPVYMVSGLKIAKGASVNQDTETTINAKIGITAIEGVADVKPLLEFLNTRTQGIAFTSKTDFILAFRVRRISFVEGKARHKLSTKGASMLDGDLEVGEVPKAILEGDLSVENAETEADKEGVEFLPFDEGADGDEFKWIVTDGKFD